VVDLALEVRQQVELRGAQAQQRGRVDRVPGVWLIARK